MEDAPIVYGDRFWNPYKTIDFKYENTVVKLEQLRGEFAFGGDIDELLPKAIKDGLHTGTLISTIVNGRPRYFPNLGSSTLKESVNGLVQSKLPEDTSDVIIKVENKDYSKLMMLDSTTETISIINVNGMKSHVIIDSGKVEYVIDPSEDKSLANEKLKDALKRCIESGRLGLIENDYKYDEEKAKEEKAKGFPNFSRYSWAEKTKPTKELVVNMGMLGRFSN
jgi:hypothetical protein